MYTLITKLISILLPLPVEKQEPLPMTLNQTVSLVREVARENLRLHKVNGIRAELLEVNKMVEDTKAASAAHVARSEQAIKEAQFDLSKVDPADPRAERKTKELTDRVERLNKELEEYKTNSTKQLEQLEKEASDVVAKITAVEDGTTKMCRQSLQEESCRLINVLADKNLLDAVAKAQAEAAQF